MPGMSDYVIMVKKQAQVFLGGPPLVKMATGEEISAEELGGAEMHSSVSGLSDYLANDDIDAIRQCRQVVATLNHERVATLPASHFRSPEPPRYSVDEILGIAQADVRQPME